MAEINDSNHAIFSVFSTIVSSSIFHAVEVAGWANFPVPCGYNIPRIQIRQMPMSHPQEEGLVPLPAALVLVLEQYLPPHMGCCLAM